MHQTIIKKQLMLCCPNLSIYLTNLRTVEQIESKNISVLSAISKIVIGQMLSRKAASTIYQRTESLSVKKDKRDVFRLRISSEV